MALHKCYNCGRMISDRAEACPKCGASQSGQPQSAPEYQEEPPRGNKSALIVVAIIGMALLVALGIVVFVPQMASYSPSEAVAEQVSAAEAAEEVVEAVEAVDASESSHHGSHGDYVEVTGVHVRLRHAPSLQGQIYTGSNGYPIYPYKGERLRCVGESGDFFEVVYNGNTLYISKQYSRRTDGLEEVAAAAVVYEEQGLIEGYFIGTVGGSRCEMSLNGHSGKYTMSYDNRTRTLTYDDGEYKAYLNGRYIGKFAGSMYGSCYSGEFISVNGSRSSFSLQNVGVND